MELLTRPSQLQRYQRFEEKKHGFRIPEINIPNEVCEECVQANQHKNSFSKDAGSKSKAILEFIYYDVCGPIQMD